MATLRAEPADIQFSEMKQDDRGGGGGVNGNENTVSLIVGGKTLYLFNLYDPENPVELAFQVRKGISSSRWAGQLVLSLFKSNVRRFCKREKVNYSHKKFTPQVDKKICIFIFAVAMILSCFFNKEKQ